MFQHFKDILDTAFECDDYFKIAVQCPDSDFLSVEKIAGCPGISTSAGVSRMTIIDEHYDWVCKWCYADDALGDACARELRTYQAAQKFGVADMFAEVCYLGEYELDYVGPDVNVWDYRDDEHYNSQSYSISMKLYGYRKANTYPSIYGSYGSLEKEKREWLRNETSPLMERNTDVAATFFREYGEELYMKLSEFCAKQRINDLHSGNVGYVGDNFVLIDYAGYFDGGEDSEYESSSKKTC